MSEGSEATEVISITRLSPRGSAERVLLETSAANTLGPVGPSVPECPSGSSSISQTEASHTFLQWVWRVKHVDGISLSLTGSPRPGAGVRQAACKADTPSPPPIFPSCTSHLVSGFKWRFRAVDASTD